MLDCLVLPLRLAEAMNQEDIQGFTIPFSSLVSIRGGSKASSSEHFILLLGLVWNSLISILFGQQEIPCGSEKSLLPVVVSGGGFCAGLAICVGLVLYVVEWKNVLKQSSMVPVIH